MKGTSKNGSMPATTTHTHRFSMWRSLAAFFNPVSTGELTRIVNESKAAHLDTVNVLEKSNKLCKEIDDQLSSTKTSVSYST